MAFLQTNTVKARAWLWHVTISRNSNRNVTTTMRDEGIYAIRSLVPSHEVVCN